MSIYNMKLISRLCWNLLLWWFCRLNYNKFHLKWSNSFIMGWKLRISGISGLNRDSPSYDNWMLNDIQEFKAVEGVQELQVSVQYIHGRQEHHVMSISSLRCTWAWNILNRMMLLYEEKTLWKLFRKSACNYIGMRDILYESPLRHTRLTRKRNCSLKTEQRAKLPLWMVRHS